MIVMLKFFFGLLFPLSLFQVNRDIYDLSFRSIEGEIINLDSFRGKKILLVNISTESQYAQQIKELDQLYRKHADSLVVIAFPSSTFKGDTLSNETIRSRCRIDYEATYIIAEKSDVKGARQNRIYRWLATKSENEVIAADINDDFKKYMINKRGFVMGIFMPFVSPIGEEISEALKY